MLAFKNNLESTFSLARRAFGTEMVRPSCKGGRVTSKTNTAHLPAAVLPERTEGRRGGGLFCGGCRKKEGRDVPSEDACSAVTEETCHLLVPGRDPPAAGGGRQAGEAAGRSSSDEIKAGLGSSLMPISRHVLNTSQLDAPGRSCGRKAEGRELLSHPTKGGLGPRSGAGTLRGPRGP